MKFSRHGLSQNVKVSADSLFVLPPQIMVPWTIVCKRTQRPEPYLDLRDLILFNYKLKDLTMSPSLTECAADLQNTDIRFPAIGGTSERVFLLAISTMVASFAPCVRAMSEAQTNVLSGDVSSLLKNIIIVERMMQKQITLFNVISTNVSNTSNHVSPMDWAKTVAKFGSAWKENVPGISGGSAPMFHALDVFLGRASYDSTMGKEMLHLRAWFPPSWRLWLDALGKVSVGDFVAKSRNGQLKANWHSLFQSYAGRDGLLGVHRLKVYGFLEQAFQTGRATSNGKLGEDETSTGKEVAKESLGLW